MFNGLWQAARGWFAEWRTRWRYETNFHPQILPPAEPSTIHQRLQSVLLTDGVSRTLFEDYARHRQDVRGEEETGWILMGIRQGDEAVALATLPAGAAREAGVAHVRFNALAQAVAARILRQEDRRLGIIGLVHTHPGSLRHPSTGDYRGDKKWVALLRGREGVFGIGTADGDEDNWNSHIATQPKLHTQCYMGFRFSWYALAADDRTYLPLAVRLTIGPDMARPLHGVWSAIEAHAERLDRLCRQQARVRFEIVAEDKGAVLHFILPLLEETSIRVVLRDGAPEYFLVRKDQWFASATDEPHIDRGVYLMLAALSESAAEES